MSDELLQSTLALVEATQAMSRDYTDIKRELKEIRQLLENPAYVVCAGQTDSVEWQELRKAITGFKKPGEIIPLSVGAFVLYQGMIPCPPPRR